MVLEISVAEGTSLGIVIGLLIAVDGGTHLCQDYDKNIQEGDYVRINNKGKASLTSNLQDSRLVSHYQKGYGGYHDAITAHESQTKILEIIVSEQEKN